MGKFAERKLALARHILDTEDEALLESMDSLVQGGTFRMSRAELDDLDKIMERHRSGDGRSSSWPTVKKRLEKLAAVKRRA